MKKLSIKLRITFWFTLFMMLSALASLSFLYFAGERQVEAVSSGEMVKLVEEFAEEIEWEEGELEFDEDFEVYQNGVYLSAYNAEGRLIYGWLPDGFELDTMPSQGKVVSVEQNNESWYLYALAFTPAGYSEELHLLAVTHAAGAGTVFSVLGHLSLALLPILLIVAALGGYLIACRAFRPVKKIIETAEQIVDGDDLSARINLPESRDEIHTLAVSFDRMFDRLEDAFENEKRFTSDVSHELRTPTAVILSECEYAVENAQTLDEAKESLVKISNHAEKLSSLISQLLLLARADNRMVLQKEKLDLTTLAEVICDEQAELAEKKSITIKRSIEPNLSIIADQTMLMRLFINLIDNAVKYGKVGGEVCVTLREEGDSICGEVSDNGIGISPEHLPHIWERFYQVDPARDPNQSGAGLGLPMVKWIAEAHGGSIRVESSLGEGSSFHFVLPKG